MSFTDLNFLFRYLPVFLILFYLLPAKARVALLIVGSYLFYACTDPRYVFLLVVLSILNLMLGRDVENGSRPAFLAACSIDVIALLIAKLAGQYADSILLPVGMSFYIFRMISWQCDIRPAGEEQRGKRFSVPESLAYFAFFPQLLSGPIMRFSDHERASFRKEAPKERSLKKKLRDVFVRLENGLIVFIPGLAFKTLLADHLRTLWDALYGIGYESISTPLAWLGAYTYSMELYYDFWGYSLMAAGIGIMLGFPMIENFRHPYAASGVGDFYRRWHMTLGNFFKDYVYIPMGGSRRGWRITVRNLAFVWLLTGIWHGVTVNYLVWAGAVLFMILLEKALADRRSCLLPLVGRIHVLLFIPITWVIFAIPDTERLTVYLLRMFPVAGTGGVVYGGDFVKYLISYGIYLLFSLVFLVPCVYDYFRHHRRSPVVTILLVVLFVMSLVSVSRAGDNPFLYLQF
ncbi:MAG: MBOAT family protein [Lachnospiraceae bacterium]|nr:MBOAT family protein [Lachnospiraceae bacterium]